MRQIYVFIHCLFFIQMLTQQYTQDNGETAESSLLETHGGLQFTGGLTRPCLSLWSVSLLSSITGSAKPGDTGESLMVRDHANGTLA